MKSKSGSALLAVRQLYFRKSKKISGLISTLSHFPFTLNVTSSKNYEYVFYALNKLNFLERNHFDSLYF